MVRPFLTMLLLALMAGSLPACTYTLSMADRTQRKVNYVTTSNNFYFWGLKSDGRVNVGKLCGSAPIYKLRDDQDIGQLLLTIVTLGIVQRRTVAVTCGHRGTPGKGTHLSEL
ncbi:MAG: hypothetical protein NTZ90_18765 [Proteobacteria bacterium]|nr:hypothetical protein [Pseudomonadota bacterium]